MFADRDRKPYRDQVPWAGEFAGKYLTSAVQILRLTGDPVLKRHLQAFVARLIAHQDADGYLGPWPHCHRLTGYAPNVMNKRTTLPWTGCARRVPTTSSSRREGSPELNCCSVNGPRGLGMVSDWVLMRDEEGLVLNWYGPSRMQGRLGRGLTVALTEATEYPRSGRVGIRVDPSQAAEFALKLRVPYWSQQTKVQVNGTAVETGRAGAYLTLARCWQPGDTIDIELDMSLHYWQGEKECRDKVSTFRGPVLLTYDRRLNAVDPDEVGLRGSLGKAEAMVVLDVVAADGSKLRLCDFASAGEGGSPYHSWLRVTNAPQTPFSRENPLRSGR